MARQYDLIVIGAGPGGYISAIKAAGLGMSVAVIEKERLGGVCLNRGCISTKCLLYASHIFSMMRYCDEFGVSTDFLSFDFGKMQDYKKRSVDAYRLEIAKLFEANHIDYLAGTAVLHRGKCVEVNNPEGRDFLEGRSIIIATGAKTMVPDIPGVDLPGIVDSERLLASSSWHYDRLLIIGGGVIGVEFATIFQALCSKVTIIEKNSHLLEPMDEEVAVRLEHELKEKGISVYCNSTVNEIVQDSGLQCEVKNELTGESSCIKASQVVIAVGRRPYLDGLMGEDVSLEIENGRLVVNSDFMTSEPGIYAIGDVVAKNQLAHVAAAQGTFVVEKITGQSHSMQLEIVPSGMFVSLPVVPNCIYTEPEIAAVGITAQRARELGLQVYCGHYSMEGNGKSIIARTARGFIRLVFESYKDTLIGAQFVCSRATDMIAEMATAIANELTAQQLLKAMRAHPTYSEGITAAIEDAVKRKGEER